MEIEYTYKGLSKTMDYANLKMDSAKKMIRRALVNGTDLTEFPMKEQKYFTGRVDLKNRKAVVYSGYCFIFANEYCVNMMKIPSWFGKKFNYYGKDRIRNPKRFIRNYDIDEAWARA